MLKLNSIIKLIGVVVKYSAVVMAIIKGIETVYSELGKLDFNVSQKSVPRGQDELNEINPNE